MKLSEEQRQALRQAGERHGLRLLLLFGSQVSGKVHAGSDIDVAAMFSTFEEGRGKLFDLAADLEVIFPGREVDVALINGADPLFLKKILEKRDLVYGEPRRLAELEMYAFKSYIDHKRYLKLEQEYVRRLLARMQKGAA